MAQGTVNKPDERADFEAFRRLVEERFSGGDTSVVDEVCSDEMVEHQDGFEPKNREGVKGAIGFLHALAPDLQITIEDWAVSGDKVWARLRGRGTHSGTILGGPTGRSFDITVMDIARIRDGKIVEQWGVADRLGQMQQWGIIANGRSR